jgi:hypothetical protein
MDFGEKCVKRGVELARLVEPRPLRGAARRMRQTYAAVIFDFCPPLTDSANFTL